MKRYSTFGPGELEARLRELKKPDEDIDAGALVSSFGGSRSKLVKEHRFAVTYADGVKGECRYTRHGPAWHLYEFYNAEGAEYLPHNTHRQPMRNTLETIENFGREKAIDAFAQACRNEVKNHFKRVTPNPDMGYKRDPGRYRMKENLAKAIGGKYAVCKRFDVSGDYTPYGGLNGGNFDTIEEANQRWREIQEVRGMDTNIVVCCGCRFHRAWELPNFNSLYAEFDPRKEDTP